MFDRYITYLQNIANFGMANQSRQVFLAVSPFLIGSLRGNALLAFFAVMLGSLINVRIFHVFFVLVLLMMDLSDEKRFKQSMMTFWLIIGIIEIYSFFNLNGWIYLQNRGMA